MKDIKRYAIRAVILLILFALFVMANIPLGSSSAAKVFNLPGLPRPIAKEPVIITSAGQSTDTYIIRDLANQLMIRSFFMPQAGEEDLKDMKTMVIVVGYSSLGSKLQGIDYDEERMRVEKLIKKAEEKKIKVITVAISGAKPQNGKTGELLELVCGHTDYLIGVRGSSNEDIMAKHAKEGDIPLTLVDEVNDISEPFASAFR